MRRCKSINRDFKYFSIFSNTFVTKCNTNLNRPIIRTFSDFKSVTERVKKIFGLDEESQRIKREKEMIKRNVGQILQSTGMFGKLWSAVVAHFAAQVLGSLTNFLNE